MADTRPLALVTGASSGIGFELACQFAANGFDVIVNAEDAGVKAAADQLSAVTPADVRPVQADLSTSDGVEELWASVQAGGRPLDAAALNAGIGRGGAFHTTPLEDELQLIDLNVRSTVHLAKRVLTQMTARDKGRLLITSSIASTMPGTYQAVYNASKSFVQSFAEALQDELRDTGVTVTALMPGPTETNFFARALMLDTPVGRSSSKDDAGEVARQGFEALMAGRRKVVAASLMTKSQAAVTAVLPDSVKAAGHRLMAWPSTAAKR